MPATKSNALNALKVKTLNVPGVYTDGNGLTLRVDKSGAKRWVQRVTIGGKQRNVGMGGYPAVGLAAARDAAIGNLQAISSGRDVIAEKKEARVAARLPTPVPQTFADEAATVIAMRRPTWSNAKHATQWESTLATYAGPVIGRKPVDIVTTADVLAVLTPIWTEKPETASRVRQRMETVFDWAIAQGRRLDNPAGKHILRVLPRLPKTRKHHPALPYADVPGALERVRTSTADWVTRLSFEFLVLTASRCGSVRLASWMEIDWESATWTIPEGRMKARREHRVPLAPRAIEILQQARELSGGLEEGLIFPANRSGKALSDMAFTVMLRRLEIPAVPHGFRRSFKSWTLEQRVDSWFVGEAALAHKLGNDTENAYVDTDLFKPRREVMEAWADFLGAS
jgi:integrase